MADNLPGAEATVYRSVAPIQHRSLSDKEREELTTLAAERSPDPSIFDDLRPVFFQTRSSNNKLDAYFTWMADSSLTNYAADATDPGVQFQNSHNGSGGFFGGGGEVGFGRSLRGKVVGPKSDRSCMIDFYTIPGLTCGNMTSDQFIMGMRSGIYADVSIGFTPGAMICNICDNDFLRKYEEEWDSPDRCSHWPGMTYDVERGNKTVKMRCELRVEDAHLNEVSVVYDGATPEAGIVAVDMARLASAQGQLREFDRTLLENIYRVRIAPPQKIHAVEEDIVTGAAKKNRTVDEAVTAASTDEETTVIALESDDETEDESRNVEETVVLDENESVEETRSTATAMSALRTKYDGTPIKLGNDPYRAIEVLADTVLSQRDTIANLHAEVKDLRRDVQDGREYRAAVLSDLDAAVVRAFGSADSEANINRYRKITRNLPISEVRELTADLNAKAGERFQGGRQTRDVLDDATEDEETIADDRERRGPTPARYVGLSR